jgi:hypothetical protein
MTFAFTIVGGLQDVNILSLTVKNNASSLPLGCGIQQGFLKLKIIQKDGSVTKAVVLKFNIAATAD